jgi:DNA-binding NtrC family response regulator
MKASELRLEETISFEPGCINLHQRRLILHDIHAFAQFRQDLVASVGLAQARRILTRFGWFSGQVDAAAMQRIFSWDSPEEWLRAGGAMGTLGGAGRMAVDGIDIQAERFRCQVTWQASAEAEEQLAAFGPSDHPACWILCGYMSGYASFCLGRQVLVFEQRCMAMGHPACIAEGRFAHEWDEGWREQKAYFEAVDISAKLQAFSADLRRKEESARRRREAAVPEPTATLQGIEIHSPTFRRTMSLAMRAARYDVPVLITGESGVGKEVLANYLHRHSDRADGPMLSINCAALPEELLESELFGHCAGSFTGAIRDRRGHFEEAAGGTLLLDEIGDISPAMQGKLLRVLQEHEITRVGESTPRPVDVRVLAATNRDLEALVRDGRFRDDLFFRLRVVEIRIPPLRERTEDILPLARHFVARAARRFGKKHLHLDGTCLDHLLRHQWPGNIRELENAIDRAAVMARSDRILPEDLPQPVLSKTVPSRSADAEAPAVRPVGRLKEVEAALIRQTLERFAGNRAKTARSLGMSTTTLWRRMRTLGDGGGR